jgi:hypothetical protein
MQSYVTFITGKQNHTTYVQTIQVAPTTHSHQLFLCILNSRRIRIFAHPEFIRDNVIIS